MQSGNDRSPARSDSHNTKTFPMSLNATGSLKSGAGRTPRIVVGVNGSPQSVEALRYGHQIASAQGVHVDAVAAWTMNTPMLDYGDPEGDPKEEAQTALQAVATSLFGQELPSHLHLVLKEGGAAEVLIAESSQADLLIIGCRGRRRFTRALLGSVSVECTERAHCPVLVLH